MRPFYLALIVSSIFIHQAQSNDGENQQALPIKSISEHVVTLEAIHSSAGTVSSEVLAVRSVPLYPTQEFTVSLTLNYSNLNNPDVKITLEIYHKNELLAADSWSNQSFIGSGVWGSKYLRVESIEIPGEHIYDVVVWFQDSANNLPLESDFTIETDPVSGTFAVLGNRIKNMNTSEVSSNPVIYVGHRIRIDDHSIEVSAMNYEDGFIYLNEIDIDRSNSDVFSFDGDDNIVGIQEKMYLYDEYTEGNNIYLDAIGIGTATFSYDIYGDDGYGNTFSTKNIYEFTLEVIEIPNTPPTIAITSGPANGSVIDYDDVTFQWQGADSDGTVVGYEYELDGTGQSVITTSKTFNDLAEGAHTFKVRSIDNDGAYSNWATRSFTITLNENPTIAITSGPANGSVIDYDDVTFQWQGADSDGTVVGYEYELDGTGVCENTTSVTYNDLAEGAHTFKVRSIDNDGAYSNWAVRTFTISTSESTVLVVNSNIEDPYNPGSQVSFYDVLETTDLGIDNCDIDDINTGAIDLSIYSTVILTASSLQNITDSNIHQSTLLIYTDDGNPVEISSSMVQFDPSTYNFTITDVSYDIADPPFSPVVNVDWEGIRSEITDPEFIIEELASVVGGPNVNMMLTAKTVSEYGPVWGAVGVIGGIAEQVFIVSLPSCIASIPVGGGLCAITGIAFAVKSLAVIAPLVRDYVDINLVTSEDNYLLYNPYLGQLSYGTINCNVYYRSNPVHGYPELVSNTPDICQNSFISLDASLGSFTYNEDYLGNEGVISLDNSFSEETSFRVYTDPDRIVFDVNDDVLEYTSENDSHSYELNDETESFNEELCYESDYLYPFSCSSNDFVVDSSSQLSSILDITPSIESGSTWQVNISLPLLISVSLEVGEGGILQLMLYEGSTLIHSEYRTTVGSQCTVEHFELEINEEEIGKAVYSVSTQFRSGADSGPLNTSELSDVILTLENYEIIWEPVTSTSDDDNIPFIFALHGNTPNPFNPTTTIRYDLPQSAQVRLVVYDIQGQEVARLVDCYLEPSCHQVQWDGRNHAGRSLPSGIYIARLVTPEYSKSIKMVLVK